MEPRSIGASLFKAQCLSLLDQVETTRIPVTVTKHGRPVARLVPLEGSAHSPTMDSVTLLADDDAAYFSSGQPWEAELGDELGDEAQAA